MDSRRILLTGLSTYWGGRLAQALEAFPEVEAVIGVDNEEPHVELERTEYVKVSAQHSLLRRVVEAAEIDTVVDTRLVVDATTTSSAKAHENNIIGTMNILAACSGAGSPVRKVVFKSSTHFYGSEQDDPAFFEETMERPHPPRTAIERDIVEAEASLSDFEANNPATTVTTLRFANVLGPDVRTSHIDLFSLPAVPMILGFDPRYQSSTRTTWCTGSSTRSSTTRRAFTTWPATGCWPSARWPACSESPTRPCYRHGERGWPPQRWVAWESRFP